MLTNQEIAEKWIKRLDLGEFGWPEGIRRAVREATEQQTERIAGLKAALKRNMSRAEEVHDLDMKKIKEQAEWIEELEKLRSEVAALVLWLNEPGYTSLFRRGRIPAGMLKNIEERISLTQNRPTSEQSGSKKTTTKDKVVDTDEGSE